jgi:hypothetical protein
MKSEEIESVAAETLARIEKFGFTVVSVSGSHSSVPFSYTVGLTGLGEPELMLIGIPVTDASIVLGNLASRVADGQRYKPGDVPADVLGDGYDVMICGPVPAVWCRSQGYPPGLAGMLYGKEAVRVYQVVYQDRNRLYPWQEGYAVPSQPYLKGGRG